MSEKLQYLSSPYSHPIELVRHERYREAQRATAFLMGAGMVVYSPVSHCHPIQTYMIGRSEPLPDTWDFWVKPSLEILSRCDQLCVLTIDGWKESTGVQAEIAFAEKAGITVWYLKPLANGAYLTCGKVEGIA